MIKDRVLLDFNSESNEYYSYGYKIIVKGGQFNNFPIFNRIKFEDKDKKKFPQINLSINNNSITYVDHNIDHKISYVEVFVLKSREDKPLVIGINTNNKMEYYKHSQLKNVGKYNYVFPSKKYDNVIEPLIEENDDFNGMVTFRIEQKNTYNHVKVATNRVGTDFSEHTHTPIPNYKQNKSIVIYGHDGGNTRVGVRGGIAGIQNNKLDSITVYFNQSGQNTGVPLLIRVTKDKKNYFFERRTTLEKRWREVQINSWNKSNKLEEKLEKINDWLFGSIIVLIHKHEEYKSLNIEYVKPTKPIESDSKNIKVTEHDCPFIGNDYVYYKHNLKVYKDSGQQSLPTGQYGFGFGSMKEMVVYIFNVAIKTSMSMDAGIGGMFGQGALGDFADLTDEDAEDTSDQPGDQSTDPEDELPLTYMDKVNDLNVYFYKGANGVDDVPLMFNYYNYWYKPNNIDDYFLEWVCDKQLTGVDPCKKEDAAKIKKHLDKVNKMLNRINLNFKVCAKFGGTMTTGPSNVPRVTAHAIVNPGHTGKPSVKAYAMTGPGISGISEPGLDPAKPGYISSSKRRRRRSASLGPEHTDKLIGPTMSINRPTYKHTSGRDKRSTSVDGVQTHDGIGSYDEQFNTYTSGSMGPSNPQSQHKYGIPAPRYLNKSYDASRIIVTCTSFEMDKRITVYNHVPRNGFGIGPTCYRTIELDTRKSISQGVMTDDDYGIYDDMDIGYDPQAMDLKAGPMVLKGRLLDAKGQPITSRLTATDPSSHTTLRRRVTRSATGDYGDDTQYPDYTDPYGTYSSLYDDNYIQGIENDLDGHEDVTAESVTVYFFNEDEDNNYPLVIEYDQGNDEYEYYVLKHCGPATR